MRSFLTRWLDVGSGQNSFAGCTREIILRYDIMIVLTSATGSSLLCIGKIPGLKDDRNQ
jgi:hypothetical protein